MACPDTGWFMPPARDWAKQKEMAISATADIALINTRIRIATPTNCSD
jgi:hypothetical protein